MEKKVSTFKSFPKRIQLQLIVVLLLASSFRQLVAISMGTKDCDRIAIASGNACKCVYNVLLTSDCILCDERKDDDCNCYHSDQADVELKCGTTDAQLIVKINFNNEVDMHCGWTNAEDVPESFRNAIPPLLFADDIALELETPVLTVHNCLQFGELLTRLHITPTDIVILRYNETMPTTLTSAHLGGTLRLQTISNLSVLSGNWAKRSIDQDLQQKLPEWHMSPEAFTYMPWLLRLTLNLNLSVLPSTLFAAQSRLSDLTVRGNLSAWPRIALQPLHGLRKLEMGQHQLRQLHDPDFKATPALTELFLTGNSIESLSANVFVPLDALQRLNLLNNQLSTLPPTLLANQTELSFLDLCRNRLETLPAQLFLNTTKLRELRLSSNRLRYIEPDTFKSLGELQLLLLNDNQLTMLPAHSFEGCYNLKELQLQHNQLEMNATLVCDIFLGLKLRDLNLSNNRLTLICSELSRLVLPELRRLNLDNNQLREVSNKLLRLWNISGTLKSVTLAQNPWNCNCFTMTLVNFTYMRPELITDASAMSCAATSQIKKPMVKLTYQELCRAGYIVPPHSDGQIPQPRLESILLVVICGSMLFFDIISTL